MLQRYSVMTGAAPRQQWLWRNLKEFLLHFKVSPGIVTTTGPVVAPTGTAAVISVLDTTVKVAGMPLKVTLVASVRLFPKMITDDPTEPELVTVSTNGLSPTESLKAVP